MYGLIFWGSSYRSDLAPLQILQNKILRNLFADKVNFVSTNDLYKQLQILKIKDMHSFECCKTVFKCIKLNLFRPLHFHLNNLTWTHNYHTRRIDDFRTPLVARTREQHDFLFQCVQQWNGLSQHLRNIQSFDTFKKLLSSNLLSTY